MLMIAAGEKLTLKDSTLREGLDTPNVRFTLEQKVKIAASLNKANVPEIEMVAPGKFFEDLPFAQKLKGLGLAIRTSGLIYAYDSACVPKINAAKNYLDRFDLLMPLSGKRPPYRDTDKIRVLLEMLDQASAMNSEVGVGFPHAWQCNDKFLLEIATETLKTGVKRVTIYDTNGACDPFSVYDLILRLKEKISVPIFFHGHNDLGLATANSISAAFAGAEGLDVTVNGLGDRAGNASLEQVAVALYLRGIATGVALNELQCLSKTVAKESGVAVSKLAPVVGQYVFWHKSPAHLDHAELFEAFKPEVVGADRQLMKH
jgi:homocitrate synthase NifV